MDFRTELSKFGYNKGNSIDVEILVNEILPSLFSQQERIGLLEIELNHTKTLLASCEKALESYEKTLEVIVKKKLKQ
jgi:hypothetical protein